jgi:hypothetical protein
LNGVQNGSYVDEFGLVSGLEVPQDRRLVEEREVGHVLAFLKLGRIHLSDLLGLEGLFLRRIGMSNE